MCERLVNVDRETPMLLPADLREWVHLRRIWKLAEA